MFDSTRAQIPVIPGVRRASALAAERETGEVRGGSARTQEADARAQLGWLRGTITELAPAPGSGHLCMIAGWIAAAHAEGEPAAWVLTERAVPLAEDLRAAGVDAAALVLVRCDRPGAVVPTADRLLRSGAFGLVVIDAPAARIATAALQRLRQLAERQSAAVVWRVLGPGQLDASAVARRLASSRERRGGGVVVRPHALRVRGGAEGLDVAYTPSVPDGMPGVHPTGVTRRGRVP